MGNEVEVRGTYDPQFESLVEEFARGIANRDDCGAALSVCQDGEVVVDVWGGHRDQERTEPWTEDTVAPMMSVGKALLATVLLSLSESGELDIEAPVADVWPEFAQAGKAAVTTRHILNHTAGLPFHERVPSGADWTRHDVLAPSLEVQPLRWPAGSAPAYHSLTMGTLVDAIVRRVTGESVASWFDAHVAAPLGIDVTFGLPAERRSRRALVGSSPQVEDPVNDGCRPEPGCAPSPEEPVRTNALLNAPAFESSEWPSINCFATARGLARFYAALLGDAMGAGSLLSRDTLEKALVLQWAACERSGGQFKRMGLGFNLGNTVTNWYGEDDRSFGHGGKGGATAFADLSKNRAVGYVTNSFYEFSGLGPRALALSRMAGSI